MRLKEFATEATVAGYKTIAARNAIANPDMIKPGQVLDIGDGVVIPKGTTYTVKPGDTLSGIAKNIQRGQVPDTASVADKPMVPSGELKAGPDRSDPVSDAPLSGGRTQAQSDALFKKQMQDVKNFFTGNNQSTPPAAAPVLDKTPTTKSAPAVRTRPMADWEKEVEASKENLKKYDADQKQRMADREKEKAAAEKAIKDRDKLRQQKTDPRVDPKGIQKKNAPTNKNVETTSDQLKSIQKSVYDQESRSGSADTSKPNYAGAIGPMQILPKTFDWVKKLGKIPKNYDINNPEHNKAAGDALLGHYHDKYKGDPKKVYAAYYAGPNAVNKDGSINTHWRDKKNPKAPTVGQYIQQTLDKMKK